MVTSLLGKRYLCILVIELCDNWLKDPLVSNIPLLLVACSLPVPRLLQCPWWQACWEVLSLLWELACFSPFMRCLSYILSTYLICLLCSLISYQQHKSLVAECSVSSIPVNSHNLLKEFTMCGSFYMYGNIVYGTPTMQGRRWRWEQQWRVEAWAMVRGWSMMDCSPLGGETPWTDSQGEIEK